MKTIGLIGGMSWESSIEYYRMINQYIREELGGLHSAKSVLVSLDFAEIEALQAAGHWDKAGELMLEAARQVEKGGGDFVVICTNTMHLLAEQVQAGIGIPVLHIADATAHEIKRKGLHQVGLLGTRFTMEKDFYRGRLEDQHNLSVLIPIEKDRKTVHEIIYQELVLGEIQERSRERYLEIIQRLADRGAEGIILGCTEIGLLVKQEDVQLAVFDTAQIHAWIAVQAALGTYPLQ
jgi:aspartate racemase